jgi:predicted nucleic acid-binding protein
MIIVDTTVWIDYLRGSDNSHTRWLNREMPYRRIGLTDLIFCEVLQGIRESNLFSQIRDEMLQRFEIFEAGSRQLSITVAQNYRNLRDRGHTPRKTIDCIVATFCIEGGHELLHRDRDFDGFEHWLRLKVIHP